MNLYFRLMLAIIRGRLLGAMSPTDTLSRKLRVLPNDIDVNLHMNNGRYLTIVDVFIVEYFMRTKMLKTMLKLGWKPMFGGHFVTYQRGLSLLEQYHVDFSVVGMDERWVFFSYTFTNQHGKVCAKGYAKGASVSRDGIVPMAVFNEKMRVEALTTVLPQEVREWLVADTTLRAAAQPAKGAQS